MSDLRRKINKGSPATPKARRQRKKERKKEMKGADMGHFEEQLLEPCSGELAHHH